jgi:hypothetical protein
MDLQGLQDMYAGIEPEKTIYRFIMDTTFRSSHKIAAACLHDNLVRLRNLTREIFIDGLSEFEASCPALTQVLREHIRSIGDNLERIKAGLHAKDDAVIKYVTGFQFFAYISYTDSEVDIYYGCFYSLHVIHRRLM